MTGDASELLLLFWSIICLVDFCYCKAVSCGKVFIAYTPLMPRH
jgi:hypothetical protein